MPDADRLPEMQELEPSPVDESPVEVNKEEYFTSSGTRSPSSGNGFGLGLSGHGPAWYLLRVQKFSTYAFSAYAALHILNTSLLPLATQSITKSDQYLLLTRPYYQSFPLEHVFITGPIILHVASGLALRLYRRHQSVQRAGAESRGDKKLVAWPKLSGTSLLGYIALPLVAGHAFLNRMLPVWVEGGNSNIGLEYVAHGIARHPVVGNLGFAALVTAACWHFVWGVARYQGWHPAMRYEHGTDGPAKRKRARNILNAVSAAVTVVWLAGGLGVVGRAGEVQGWLGREYDAILSHVPLIGHLL